ncbi:Dnaj-like protein [Leishmania tarentolae]|uniref:Dnaj-like protein n=1 Tax=Leishmania tarentolae TaxID=5689 RepID=A0A640KRY8_LEITA|nr:Dnaj-like protein [Leishmania tarentolae]
MSAALGMVPEVVSSSASSSSALEEPTSDTRDRATKAENRSPELSLNTAPANASGLPWTNNINVNKVSGVRAGATDRLQGGTSTHRGANGVSARFTDPKDENGFTVFSRRPTGVSVAVTGASPKQPIPTSTFASNVSNGSGATSGHAILSSANASGVAANDEHPAVVGFAKNLSERHLRCALCAKVVVDVVLIGAQASVACRRCALALPGTQTTELPRPLRELLRMLKVAAGLPEPNDDFLSDRRILRAKRPAPINATQPHGAESAAKEETEAVASSSSAAAAAASATTAMQAVLAELTDAEAAERQQIDSAEASSRADITIRKSAASAPRAAPAAASGKSNGATSRQYKLEADRKYENAEYVAALELYTKAIRLQPIDHQSNVKFLYGNRSAAHYMAQRYNECIEDCLEVVRLDPSSVKMLSRAARSACTMGDLKRAVEIMESTPKDRLTSDMEAELARYKNGLEAYRHAERCFGTPEGDEQYRMLVAQFSDTVPFRVRCAESLRHQRHYMRAVEVLEALSYSTRTPAACRIMSECLYLSGFEYFERARKCIVEAAQLDDACNDLLKKIDAVDDGKQKGNSNFNKKNYGPASEYYTTAIQAAADNDQVLRVLYCNRAAAYKELGRYREGVEDCTKTLQIDNEFYKAYARRARCHEHLGDHFAAVRDFKKAMEYDSTDRELARELRAAEQNLAKEAEKERDFYFQLGVSRTATEREIKLKYRELSLRWHPDKCIGLDEVERERAEHKFKIISEAYATLVDAVKRREYDAKQDRERFTRSGGFNFSSTYSGGSTNDYYRGRHRAGGNGFW